jgi:phage tail-like protein
MPIGDRRDPYHSYNFLVEIDGITRAGFRECSGLDSSQEPINYREGSDPLTTRRLPGLVQYSNITLRWGISDDADLWEWRQAAADGKVERRNGSIVLRDDTGTEKLRWNFRDGWPTKWTGPTLNATGNEVAIESLEIVHEGIARA